MDAATTMTSAISNQVDSSPLHEQMNKCEQMLQRYWDENPDLYRIVQLKKHQSAANHPHPKPPLIKPCSGMSEGNVHPILPQILRGAPLREKSRTSHHEIRQRVLALNADIILRTTAHNRKCAYQSLEEERDFRADVVAAQIQSWRSLLPMLIRKFSKIPDYRRPGCIKHKITVLMVFGLFSFIFRLSSRREMNRELTSPVIFNHLKKLFPEIDSIPHADTLARLLEKINPQAIEAAHINLIKDLISKKKFKHMLIHGCLPITIDGTQKLYRDNLLQDDRWCERTVGNAEDNNKQQYIYVIEANITLKNGLTIPLMTEYLTRETNQLMQPEGKQDSGTPRGVYIPKVKVLTGKQYPKHPGSSFELMEATT